VDPRALFLDRILPGGLALDTYAGGDYWPSRSWAQSSCNFAIQRHHDSIAIVCSFLEPGGEKSLEKRIEFAVNGNLTVSYRWDPSIGQPTDLFAPEISLSSPLEIRSEPEADVWTFPIETVAKSERGLDRTVQGQSVTLRWPVHLGEATVELAPERLAEKQELQAADLRAR
jgi:hypothetical protein